MLFKINNIIGTFGCCPVFVLLGLHLPNLAIAMLGVQIGACLSQIVITFNEYGGYFFGKILIIACLSAIMFCCLLGVNILIGIILMFSINHILENVLGVSRY